MKKMSLKRMLESAEEGSSSMDVGMKYMKSELDIFNLPEELKSSDIAGLLAKAEDLPELASEGDIRDALIALQSSIAMNAKARCDHSTDPSMFLESELDLDEAIKRFHQMALIPSLFQYFADARGHILLLSLLDHPNEEVGLEVLRVFGDLTDESVLEQADDPDRFLVSLIESEAPAGITNFLSRLLRSSDPNSESALVCLEVISNFMEGYPDSHRDFTNAGLCDTILADLIATQSKNTSWQYCVSFSLEILVELVQTLGSSIVSQKGLDVVLAEIENLVTLDLDKSATGSERNQNLVDLVVLLLDRSGTCRTYLDQKNIIQAFVSLLRSPSRDKISFGMHLCSVCVADSPRDCDAFIAHHGLRVLGALLAGKVHLTKEVNEIKKQNEYLLGLVYNLLSNCSDEHRIRILAKLSENNLEKTLPIVDSVSQLLSSMASTNANANTYLERCENGLLALQWACLIVLTVFGELTSFPTARKYLVETLNSKAINMQDFIQIVYEYMQLRDVGKAEGTELETIQKHLELFQSEVI